MTNKPKTFKITSYQRNSNQNKRAYHLNLSTCQKLFLKENYIKSNALGWSLSDAVDRRVKLAKVFWTEIYSMQQNNAVITMWFPHSYTSLVWSIPQHYINKIGNKILLKTKRKGGIS